MSMFVIEVSCFGFIENLAIFLDLFGLIILRLVAVFKGDSVFVPLLLDSEILDDTNVLVSLEKFSTTFIALIKVLQFFNP